MFPSSSNNMFSIAPNDEFLAFPGSQNQPPSFHAPSPSKTSTHMFVIMLLSTPYSPASTSSPVPSLVSTRKGKPRAVVTNTVQVLRKILEDIKKTVPDCRWEWRSRREKNTYELWELSVWWGDRLGRRGEWRVYWVEVVDADALDERVDGPAAFVGVPLD